MNANYAAQTAHYVFCDYWYDIYGNYWKVWNNPPASVSYIYAWSDPMGFTYYQMVSNDSGKNIGWNGSGQGQLSGRRDLFLGYTSEAGNTFPPTIYNVLSTNSAGLPIERGTSSSVTVGGLNLGKKFTISPSRPIFPYDPNGEISASFTSDAPYTSGTLIYTIPMNTLAANYQLFLRNPWGDSNHVPFQVYDPPPMVNYVYPVQWQAGVDTPIEIRGTGLCTPSLTFSDSRVHFTMDPSSAWDTQIKGIIRIDATAAANDALAVTITSDGTLAPNRPKSVMRTVRVIPVIETVTVAITPQYKELSGGQTQVMAATVTATTNIGGTNPIGQGVTWSLSPIDASRYGSISSTGVYTAPATITVSGPVTITATSVDRPAAKGFATIVLLSAPAITTQPASQTVAAGTSAQFSVVAIGGGLSYQWLKNGVAISGATNAIYQTPVTATGDSGARYSVRVTNSVGYVLSSEATLTVRIDPPVITKQPAGVTVLVGTSANFSVTASSAVPWTYQWKQNGSPIAGANQASYTTPPVTLAYQSYVYSVDVANSAGTTSSSGAVLNVDSGVPVITVQPQDQRVILNTTPVTFSVATSTAYPTFEWFKNGTLIAGATSSNCFFWAPALTDNNASIYAVVTNSYGSTSSRVAKLTVVDGKPVITEQPQDLRIHEGYPAWFNVQTYYNRDVPETYQWHAIPVGGSDYVYATTMGMQTTRTTRAMQGWKFYVIVTNRYGSVQSRIATLSVDSAPAASGSIGSTPIVSSNGTITLLTGQTTSIYWSSIGSTSVPTTYQWYRNNVAIPGANNSSIYTSDPGVTMTQYALPAVTSLDTGSTYHVTATNTFGSVTSPVMNLIVYGPPVITVQPTSVTTIAGATATFSVTAVGIGLRPYYQWSRNGVALPDRDAGAQYTTPALSVADNGANYTCTINTSYGSVTSQPATLTVTATNVITLQIITPSAGGSVTVNTPLSCSASVSGTNPNASYTYAWNFGDQSGATGSTQATHTYTSTGTYPIVFTATDQQGITASASRTITIQPLTSTVTATITSPATDRSIRSGLALAFQGAGTSSNPTATLTYSWDFGDGTVGSGASVRKIYTSDEGDSFDVTLTVSDGQKTATATRTITVLPRIIIKPGPLDPSI